MIEEKEIALPEVSKEEWAHAKCDKYDYLTAVFCGAAAGLIDVVFVGDPNNSKLGKFVDKAADGFVIKAAQFFWKHDKTSGKSKKMPETLQQCISYLEQAFHVNYDARYAGDLNANGALGDMNSKNHHLLSLAHSPSPIGLIFSIIDQFTGKATFVDHGKIIHLEPNKSSGAIPYMQGTNLPSKLFCGFVNWIGHIISDMAGSSSSRQKGKTGRGSGVPIPFYELFLFCDFGNINGKTLADKMIEVFEQGYDSRFGATMAIPVVLEELTIKVIWMIRQKFLRKKSWQESFPTKTHADLRIMLIVGNATLCLIDGVDAAMHGISESNVVTFICHLNLIGWARLVMLVLKELAIRYAPEFGRVLDNFVHSVLEKAEAAERRQIEAMQARLAEYDNQLWIIYCDFAEQIEREYFELYNEIGETFNETENAAYRAEHSVKLAQVSHVSENKIMHNTKELDDFFIKKERE